MKLLAIDLGKFKSVACLYYGDDDVTYRTIETRPQVIHDLLVELMPDRLVVEVGTVTGWVHDLAVALEIDVQVANPNTEGWRWRRVKRKTDRDDALKLARLSAADQLPTVWMPAPRVRQWRALINYRHALVSRRTAIRNTIRSILDTQGERPPTGAKAWTEVGLALLHEMARPIATCSSDELWRGQLHTELMLLAQLAQQLQAVEDKLDAVAEPDPRPLACVRSRGWGLGSARRWWHGSMTRHASVTRGRWDRMWDWCPGGVSRGRMTTRAG